MSDESSICISNNYSYNYNYRWLADEPGHGRPNPLDDPGIIPRPCCQPFVNELRMMRTENINLRTELRMKNRDIDCLEEDNDRLTQKLKNGVTTEQFAESEKVQRALLQKISEDVELRRKVLAVTPKETKDAAVGSDINGYFVGLVTKDVAIGPNDSSSLMGPEMVDVAVGPEDTSSLMGPEMIDVAVGPEGWSSLMGPGMIDVAVGPEDSSSLMGTKTVDVAVGLEDSSSLLGPDTMDIVTGLEDLIDSEIFNKTVGPGPDSTDHESSSSTLPFLMTSNSRSPWREPTSDIASCLSSQSGSSETSLMLNEVGAGQQQSASHSYSSSPNSAEDDSPPSLSPYFAETDGTSSPWQSSSPSGSPKSGKNAVGQHESSTIFFGSPTVNAHECDPNELSSFMGALGLVSSDGRKSHQGFAFRDSPVTTDAETSQSMNLADSGTSTSEGANAILNGVNQSTEGNWKEPTFFANTPNGSDGAMSTTESSDDEDDCVITDIKDRADKSNIEVIDVESDDFWDNCSENPAKIETPVTDAVVKIENETPPTSDNETVISGSKGVKRKNQGSSRRDIYQSSSASLSTQPKAKKRVERALRSRSSSSSSSNLPKRRKTELEKLLDDARKNGFSDSTKRAVSRSPQRGKKNDNPTLRVTRRRG